MKTLTPRQERFITELQEARSIRDAAAAAGVAERTARYWLAQPTIRRALQEATTQRLSAASAQSASALAEALAVLRDLLSAPDTPPAVKVSAARAVIECGFKTIDAADFAERLAALESRLEATQ